MKRGLIIFIVMCTFAAAMVSRDRRALNTEDDAEMLRRSTTTTTEKPKEICAPQTPCAWAIYKPIAKFIEMNITNRYCECASGTFCQVNEDDLMVSAYIHRCRPPMEDQEAPES